MTVTRRVGRIQGIENADFGQMDQSAERMAHKSGKTGVINVDIR
jgi:hypothetical protein